jgi:C4-dicarboxylate-specific signal transduction histidine kinase
MSVATIQAKTLDAAPPEAEEPEVILVVEDDAALLKVIEKRLAASGYRTVGVANGASALAWLKHDSPGMMLLDYSLPDMRGEQLIEQLHLRGRNVPFVVATGHGSESVAVEMMKRGAYDYLVKGASFMKLLPVVLNRALERARQSQRLIEAEEQLREAHEELEQRVLQRTAQLAEANQRLIVEMEERRRAEQQSRQHQAELAHVARLSTVGEMVAELAHELNQPLGAISSYAQACRRLMSFERPEDHNELSDSLGRITDQADRAAEIIRRLRRFITKAKPSQTTVDINAMIHDVAALTNIDARTDQVDISFNLTDPLPPVVGDRIQLEQVMVNLIRNALDAMRDFPPHARQLTIGTAVENGRRVRVDVCDSGVGIPADMMDCVFDRFFTTKPNGMGMGLSISRSIITNHGGLLWATSNVDHGSTFHFTLPIDQGEHDRGN